MIYEKGADLMWTKRRANKYGNNITSGCQLKHSHRSKLEASVCSLLYLRMLAGEFMEILTEVRIDICGPLGHPCDHKHRVSYRADFQCIRPDGSHMFAEAKGRPDQKWPLKLRLYKHYRSERLEIWGGDYRKPKLIEVVNAER